VLGVRGTGGGRAAALGHGTLERLSNAYARSTGGAGGAGREETKGKDREAGR